MGSASVGTYVLPAYVPGHGHAQPHYTCTGTPTQTTAPSAWLLAAGAGSPQAEATQAQGQAGQGSLKATAHKEEKTTTKKLLFGGLEGGVQRATGRGPPHST